jgi:hypothetical protein
MIYVITLSNFLAALSSALAAFFWYRAAQVQAPPNALFGVSGFADANYGNGFNSFVDAKPLVEYAQDSGRRNKIAALWSAAAALFAFLAWCFGLAAHA